MHQLTLICIALFFTIDAFSQNNRISLTINEYQKFNTDLEQNDTMERYSNKGIKLFPSLGYYRLLNNNWGLGLELGYKKIKTKFTDTFTNAVSERVTYLSTTNSKEIYFCPTLFQLYNWKKFLMNTSITIPLMLRLTNKEYVHLTTTYKPSNLETLNRTLTRKNPREINWGIFCNIGFYRQITKNVYFGPQLAFGFSQQIKSGTTHEQVTSIENGIQTQYDTDIKYKSYFNSQFDLRPSLSLQYIY